MRIIFLDFYGVMDGPLEREFHKSHPRFDPKCGKLINDLCNEFDAKIVVTSDAVQEYEGEPLHKLVEEAYQHLVDCGISEHMIVGYLYQSADSIAYWDRPKQIKSWVEDNNIQEYEYVIFDDLPLLFLEEDILKYKREIAEDWTGTEEYRQEWIDRLPKPNPEAAKRFIRVNGKFGLRPEDINKAREIFNA